MIDRRQFILTSLACAGGLGLSSCAMTGAQNAAGMVDAGKLTDYLRDGEVDRFAKSHGFMLSTFGGKLIALSSVCSYRDCNLEVSSGQSGFNCPCHGCQYDRFGSVRKGPAHNPLVHFVMSLNAAQHVMVDTTQRLIQPEWGRVDSYLIVKS